MTATTGKVPTTIICSRSSGRYTAREVPTLEPAREPTAAGMAQSQLILPDLAYRQEARAVPKPLANLLVPAASFMGTPASR